MPVTDADYNSTLAITDVTVADAKTQAQMSQVGVSQDLLFKLLNDFATNFNAMLAKLDADAGVTGTNYAALWTLTLTSTANGMSTVSLATDIIAIAAKIAGVNAKLDLDGGVTDVNYASLINVTVDSTKISTNGIQDQGDVIDFLDTVTTNFNALLTKLDADA